MTRIKTSPWALAAALAPLGAMHLFTVFLILGRGGDPLLSSPDAALGAIALRLGTEAALLSALHLGLGSLGRNAGAAYSLAGAAAALGSYGLGLATGLWPKLAPDGALVTTALLPALVGAAAGLLYRHVAGFDGAVRAGEAVQAFSGPVQVRTAPGAFAVLALAPTVACLLAVAAFGLAQHGTLGRVSPAWVAGKGSWAAAPWATLAPLGFVASSLLVSSLPILVLAGTAHALARAFKRVDYRSYGLAGFACTLVLPVLFGRGAAWVVAMPVGIVGAAVALAYRRLAGLEPVPLPEHLVVREREALVEADHATRHGHRVAFEN